MTPNNTKSLGSNLAKLFNLDPDEIDDSILMSVGAAATKMVMANLNSECNAEIAARGLRIAREDG